MAARRRRIDHPIIWRLSRLDEEAWKRINQLHEELGAKSQREHHLSEREA
jgi:hypothetical protein